MKNRPIVAITIGDINGIGPEVIVKALAQAEIRQRCLPLIVGPIEVLRQQAKNFAANFEFRQVAKPEALLTIGTELPVLSPDFSGAVRPEPGRISAKSGAIAGWALEQAVELAQNRKVDAIVTAPIAKLAFNLAGYHYPGHTEFLQERTYARDFLMLLLSGNFRVGLVTTHYPISEVANLITRTTVFSKIKLFHHDLRTRFGIAKPQLAVAALNPHGGEGGMFGQEETKSIGPAIQAAKRLGMAVQGPFAADTLFAATERHDFDGYLAMYHDQGLIPLKMKAFGRAVNYTAGLPIIRTSPDHGTAFDIAGQGVADPGSMVEAIKLAIALASKTD